MSQRKLGMFLILFGFILIGLSAYSTGYKIGFGAGKANKIEEDWAKGRIERLGYYLGGDLRGWDIRSVEFVYDLESETAKELALLTKGKRLAYDWGLRMGISKETKEPLILVVVSNGESFFDGIILIDAISMVEINKRLDEKWRQGAALSEELKKEIQNNALQIANKIMAKS